MTFEISPGVRLCRGEQNLSKEDLVVVKRELLNSLLVIRFGFADLESTSPEFVRIENSLLEALERANRLLGNNSN